MMNVAARFQSYLSSLELTEPEREEAAYRQEALRERLHTSLAGVIDSRLVGSYPRRTAIRPLEDIDVFVVLDERQHRRDAPSALLRTLADALRAAYPDHEPRIQARSVNLAFPGTGIGYDVAPAFAPTWAGARDTDPPYYEILDRNLSAWIPAMPPKHAEACIAANRLAGGMLDGLIKAVKHWNRASGKPLSGFHLEVMSYAAFSTPPRDTRTGLRDLFQHLTRAVQFPCPDPARLGPALDDLTPQERTRARGQLHSAAELARAAVDAELTGDHDTASVRWRSLLGPGFPR
ncbi:MAG: nucleotidyltransferase [Deltaproteobacteria bacterium]|nr:nucleotidyltransferase [Deltaproteobacteria bacterium]